MIGRRILVPLDGSGFGERALPLATEIARRTEGTLHLVTVETPWPLADAPPEAAAVRTSADTAVREGLASYLDTVVERVAGTVTVERELRVGVVDDEILAAARDHHCDLIAMATHGRGGFDRLWLGSVADRVMRHSTLPVLLVPAPDTEPVEEAGDEAPSEGSSEAPSEGSSDSTAGGAAAPGGRRPLRTVIIPLDGSAFSEQVMVPATALGELFSADYVLYRSVPPRIVVGSPYMAHAVHTETQLVEAARAVAKSDTEAAAARLREAGYTATVTVAEGQEPVGPLLRLAHGEPGSLIAMTTHGRGGLRRAVLGSTADKLVRGSRRPVLLLRPEEAP